ncbi:hypothetical protein [Yoonia sp.]|uniref:hypothetical protein n=1 Tax=Yoonia sp. TaxID=2212373 RepID=UPI002FDA4591
MSGQYAAGAITGRGYFFGISDADGTIFGANGSYDFGSGISAFLAVESATEEVFGGDYSALTAGAGYEFAPGVSVEGSIGRLSLGPTGEVDTL